MLYQGAIRTLALAAALGMSVVGARAFDDASYPDWTGSWRANCISRLYSVSISIPSRTSFC